MISGQPMTERQYRQVDALSQSMLKDFADDRKKFYKKYILNEEVEEDISQAIKMGNLVDCLLLTPDDFENKFFMSICTEAPTGLMLAFVKALARYTLEATNEAGEVTEAFSTLLEKAHARSGFKWDLSRVLDKFTNQEPENYYQELRASLVSKKMVVTGDDIENANRIVTALRTGEFTAPILNLEDGEGLTIYNQFAVDGFVVEGRPCKGLIDRLEINHTQRYIQPWDLKATWSVEDFHGEYYLKRKGHLQAAMYDLGCTHLRNLHFEGYEVRPMKLIVCDSINYYSPLIYEMAIEDLMDAFNGFTHRGRFYKGLIQLIRELNWHMDSNVWNMSMVNYLNKGRVTVQSLKQP